MSEAAPGRGTCVTCGDVAVVARVVEVRGAEALVDADGRVERVATDLVPGVAPGDRLVCHAGIAIGRVEEGGGS